MVVNRHPNVPQKPCAAKSRSAPRCLAVATTAAGPLRHLMPGNYWLASGVKLTQPRKGHATGIIKHALGRGN
jgi:hypothetical protein